MVDSIDEGKYLTINEEDLIEHSRLIKKNITKGIAEHFEIVKSVRHEEQFEKFDGSTAVVDWKIVKEYIDKRSGKMKTRTLRVFKELFAEDYKFIDGV